MPSDPTIPLNPMPGRGSPAAPLPIPSFGMLARGSMLQRMKSNFAECITAAPRGIPPRQFAVMFRSAYIPKRFPTRPLLQSIFLHVCVLTFWISLPTAPDRRRTADEIETARAENRLIYYTPTDRLPPVSPLEPEPQPPQPQSPRVRLRMARGPERVVSRPPRPDNSRQTIVQPDAPQWKLPTDVEIPNLVAWRPAPPPPSPSVSIPQPKLAQIPAPPVPAPAVPTAVPVPPKLTMPKITVPAAPSAALSDAPVPPPPSPVVSIAQPKRAQIQVPRAAAPAVPSPTPAPPKLTLSEASVPPPPSAGLPNAPIPPRPSVAEGQQQLAELRVPRMPNLVAVGVAPAPPPVRIEIPPGNRSGEFAISPDGEEMRASPSGPSGEGDAREAPSLPQFGTMGEVADIRVPNLSIAGDRSDLLPPEAPPVLVVAEVPKPRVEPRVAPRSANPSPVQPEGDLRTLMVRATRPSFPDMPRGKAVDTLPAVFGDRRIYTVYINMPNLASGAGSWILRFAERDGDEGGGTEIGDEGISSPVAVRKVDPKYAPAAIRERVEGTVTLAAQILRSGKVTSVRVVQGVDPRLDLSAVQALTLWQFEPARKKGVPIDLEVLVQIPFHLPAF